MQGDILQKFLDRGLLNLGEDPEKFNYVTLAAADLANLLKEGRRELIRASSILVGPTLDEREPLLESCAGAIAKHWPTYRGRFPSNATQLFRATLLQAIANITGEESDVECMAIVYYTTCGLIPFLTNTEDSVLREFASTLGSRLEAEAVKSWGSAKDNTVPSPEYVDVSVATSSIDAKWLKDALKAAATNAGTNPNPHGVGSPDWGEHFGQNASNAIATGASHRQRQGTPSRIGGPLDGAPISIRASAKDSPRPSPGIISRRLGSSRTRHTRSPAGSVDTETDLASQCDKASEKETNT